MVIKTQLSKKEFVNASFTIFYSKMFIRIYTLVLIIIFIVGLLAFIFSSNGSITQATSSLFMLLMFPIIAYLSAIRSYRVNKRISETIEYNILDESLQITGESFNSTFSWNKVYKVSKTKKWLFIWHNSQIANPIKLNLFSKKDLDSLKSILNNQNVKNNL